MTIWVIGHDTYNNQQIEHFPFDVWPWPTKIHVQVYRSIWCKTHYDVTHKNSNVSSEGLDRHYHKYHSLSYQTPWDISDNVCLDLQNCRYSIYKNYYCSQILLKSKTLIILRCNNLICKLFRMNYTESYYKCTKFSLHIIHGNVISEL